MERYLWITLFMALGLVAGWLVSWWFHKTNPDPMKLIDYLYQNCTEIEIKAFWRCLPGMDHSTEDMNITARILRDAPEDIKQSMRDMLNRGRK
jgi:hypothetical protein